MICEACNDDGFLLVNNNVHGVRIEKCDACDVCKTDAEANEKAFRLACKALDALAAKDKALEALKALASSQRYNQTNIPGSTIMDCDAHDALITELETVEVPE